MTTAGALFGDAPCACCQKRGHLTVDHRIPRSLGGTDDPKNLRPCCWRCNQTKSKLESIFAETYVALQTDGGRERWRSQFLQALKGWCKDRQHGKQMKCRCAECRTVRVLVEA